MTETYEPTPEFLSYVTAHQLHLKAFILSSVGSRSDVDDILQKTNTIMLSKARSFPDKNEFLAWATTIARYEILAYVRDRQRDRLVFSPELVEAMSGIADAGLGQISDRQEALRTCLSQLPEAKLQMLRYRYGSDLTLAQISLRVNRTVDSIKSALLRVRRLLKKCVTAKIEAENQL